MAVIKAAAEKAKAASKAESLNSESSSSSSKSMSTVSESVIDSLLKKKQNDNYREQETQYDDHVDSNLIEKIKKESDEELFSDDVESR